MHLQTLLAAAATLYAIPAAATKSTTLTSASFGIDPLIALPESSGNQVVTSVIYDPANAHTGDGYLSVSFPAADRQYAVFGYPYTLAAHTNYTAEVYAMSPNATGDCYIALEFFSNNDTQIGYTTEVVKKNYGKFSLTVDSGANEAKGDGVSGAYFYVTCTGGVAETVYLDDFKLTTP